MTERRTQMINRYILIKRILKHPPIQLAIPGSSPGLHLLACHAHVLISLYALCSWYQTTGLSTPLIIHDDGSLSSEDVEIYQHIFPAGRLIANRLLSSKDLLGYPGWMEQTIWAVLSARRGLEMLPERLHCDA